MTARIAPVFLVLALAGPVRADMITFGPQPFTIGPNQTVTLHFPQFDPSLGELTLVNWERFVTRSEGQVVSFDNESGDPYDHLLFVGASARGSAIGIPDGLEIIIGSTLRVTRSLGPDDDNAPDFTGDDSLILTNTGTDTLHGGAAPLNESWPQYVGTGTVTFTIDRFTSFGGSPFPTIAARVEETGFISSAVSLSYHFTPVPEPSTFILVGLVTLVGACYGVPKLRGMVASVPPL